jgi:hypothetical protein
VYTRRGANIGICIALTVIVGGALVWDRIYRIPRTPRNPLPANGSLLVLEHGGVPARQRTAPLPEERRVNPILRDHEERRRETRVVRREPPTPLRTHVVRDGDSLSSIAFEVYRKSSRWPEIARANKLSDPFLIRAGDKLRIP